MADVAYATGVAQRFVRALAGHGTTTALVFGSHFAPATAALFDAATEAGLRVISGLVVSDRCLRPDLHRSPQDAYRDSTELIRLFHQRGRLLYAVTPRFALSASEAMLEMCQTLLGEHDGLRVQTHINESVAEIAEVSRLFPESGDYLAVPLASHGVPGVVWDSAPENVSAKKIKTVIARHGAEAIAVDHPAGAAEQGREALGQAARRPPQQHGSIRGGRAGGGQGIGEAGLE